MRINLSHPVFRDIGMRKRRETQGARDFTLATWWPPCRLLLDHKVMAQDD